MTNKELNKVQNEVKKASEKTLTGAVKAWCQLFKSGKEINEILKENDIKVDKAVVPALVALAKDKEVVIQLCKEILPRVNNTFCAYKEVEREYYDKNDKDKKCYHDTLTQFWLLTLLFFFHFYHSPISIYPCKINFSINPLSSLSK